MNRIDGPGIAEELSCRQSVISLMDGALVHTYIERFWTDTPDATPLDWMKTFKGGVSAATKPTPETVEPTDEELYSVWARMPGIGPETIGRIFRLGVALGESKVCAKLPRLWGWWHPAHGWKDESFHSWGENPIERVMHFIILGKKYPFVFCEFDPRTGGPKG